MVLDHYGLDYVWLFSFRFPNVLADALGLTMISLSSLCACKKFAS